MGFAWLKLNQTDENQRLELRITATDDGYVTEEGLNAMQLGAFGTGRAVPGRPRESSPLVAFTVQCCQ